MILKERDKLIKEIQATFNAKLADAGIHGLSDNARSELLGLITRKIDYLYFPSTCQQVFEFVTVVPLLLRICLSTCSSFRITISEHDSAELRGLSQANLRELTASIREILEQYRDLEEEARLRREAEASRREYESRQESKGNRETETRYRGSFTYTPAYAGAGRGAFSTAGNGPGPASNGAGPAASSGPSASGESAAASAIADLQASVRDIESLLKRR